MDSLSTFSNPNNYWDPNNTPKIGENDFGHQNKILTFPPSTFPKVIPAAISGPRMNSKYAFSARHCLSVSRIPQP